MMACHRRHQGMWHTGDVDGPPLPPSQMMCPKHSLFGICASKKIRFRQTPPRRGACLLLWLLWLSQRNELNFWENQNRKERKKKKKKKKSPHVLSSKQSRLLSRWARLRGKQKALGSGHQANKQVWCVSHHIDNGRMGKTSVSLIFMKNATPKWRK